MIDLRELKSRYDEIKTNIKNRSMKIDLDAIIALQEERNSLLQEVESLRFERNENAQKMKGKLNQETRARLIEEGKNLKTKIAETEERFNRVEEEYLLLGRQIPNYAHPSAPVGKEDTDNLVLKRVGTPPTFSFNPLDHVELGEKLDLIDFEAGTKVTGPKFYFLKNEAVILQMALERYALDILIKHGFSPYITPDIAKEEILEGIGFNPRGPESNIYTLEGTGTALVGTAEITLGGYHAEEILEAGSAGQFSKGLYRVHQFSKVEMFIYCLPEESDAIHEQLLEIEEEIFSGLGLAYQVVDTCTGDLGAPAYRKFDIEAWMPGRGENGEYGEVTSTSNCTDYQSRSLRVRYKDANGQNQYVHTLNGTAVATSRAIVAILENFQEEDGSIRIPPALVPYTGFDRIGG